MIVRWQHVFSLFGRDYPHAAASAGFIPADVIPADLIEDQYWKYFGFIVVAAFLMRLACYTGLIGSDDMGYSHFAQLIAQHHYRPELHHYALRFGLIIPVGAMYALFGVREWTTIILPLLASTASVPVVMLIAEKLFSRRVALLSGLMVATFPVALRYATILVPEPLAELYALLGILAYLYWGASRPEIAGVLTGLCIGVAYLTKEPTLFIAPALMIDALAMRRWRLFFGLSAGVLSVVSTEHAYYLLVTGDLAFRSHAMVLHNQTVEVLKANQHVFWRLFKVYPRIMIRPSLSTGLHSLFALFLVIPAVLLLSFKKSRIPLLWALLPLLYLNFGTSSFQRYWLLPADERYVLFIYPPLFMLTAEFLVRLGAQKPKAVPLMGFVFTVVLVSGFYCGFVTRAEGWRTIAVSDLRNIAETARSENLHLVAFEGTQPEEWREALGVLDRNLQPDADSGTADIVIAPDDLGEPSVVASRRHPSGSKSAVASQPFF
jgi:hypothetical protein